MEVDRFIGTIDADSLHRSMQAINSIAFPSRAGRPRRRPACGHPSNCHMQTHDAARPRLSGGDGSLDDILARRRPPPDALKDWGPVRHRFAGSKDRAGVATIVYDALAPPRLGRPGCWGRPPGEDTGRALVLAFAPCFAAAIDTVPSLRTCASGRRFAPAPLSDDETRPLEAAGPDGRARGTSQATYPEWTLHDELVAGLRRRRRGEARRPRGARAARHPRQTRCSVHPEEGADALAILAPIEVRTWTRPSAWHPPWRRRRARAGAAIEPKFIQGLRRRSRTTGSRSAALSRNPGEKAQVVDLCAGAGGKTLALAALMDNAGQIYATDLDARRLAPIHDRLARSGARNVQIRSPPRQGGRGGGPRRARGRRPRRTRPARAPAPGGATPTPSGACGRARWSSAAASRSAVLDRAAAARQARRAHRLRHLLGPARGERRRDRGAARAHGRVLAGSERRSPRRRRPPGARAARCARRGSACRCRP